MKVILTKDVKSLGDRGNVVSVSDGYARNFLFPRNMAVNATESTIKHEEERLKVAQIKEDKLLGEAQEKAKTLEGKVITLTSKAGDEGKLYGSITSKEVAEAINSQLGYEVDKRKVSLEEAIRTLGDHKVSFKIHSQVAVNVTVTVKEEK